MELGDVGKYDQLVLVVVQDNDAGDYMKALSESGFAHTRILSAGGFLRATNALFVVAISSDRLADLRSLSRYRGLASLTSLCRLRLKWGGHRCLLCPSTELSGYSGWRYSWSLADHQSFISLADGSPSCAITRAPKAHESPSSM